MAYRPPSMRASSSNDNKTYTIKNGAQSVTVDELVAQEWTNLQRGTFHASDVPPAMLSKWHDLVTNAATTRLSEIGPLASQLRPTSYVWATRVILDNGARGGFNREDMLRHIGDEVRRDNRLAGDYYFSKVPHRVHGNFTIWKDAELLNSPEKESIISKTPLISIIVGVLQQTWLLLDMPDSVEEFPVTQISWDDLSRSVGMLDFFGTTTEHHSDYIHEAYKEALSNPVASVAQYALVAHSTKFLPHMRPRDRKETATAIRYDVGTLDDRMSMTKKELFSAGNATRATWEDEEVSEPLDARLSATRLVYDAPGDETDAMLLFNALVTFYSTTDTLNKKEKMDRMGVRNLVYPSDVFPPHADFTWPIMREILYMGQLSYDYSRFDLAISNYEEVAKNLSRHLDKKAYKAFHTFLESINANPVLVEAMTGKLIKYGTMVNWEGRILPEQIHISLPSYSATLPTLTLPSSADVEKHNKQVLLYNKLHGVVPKVKLTEKEKKDAADREKKEAAEARKREREQRLKEMEDKKKASQQKKDAADAKRREEQKRRAAEHLANMRRKVDLPEEDEYQGLPE